MCVLVWVLMVVLKLMMVDEMSLGLVLVVCE